MDTDRFATLRKGTLLSVNPQPDYPEEIQEEVGRPDYLLVETITEDNGYVFRFVKLDPRERLFPVTAESLATRKIVHFHPCEVTIAEEQDHD